jgi:hypothetical protein
VHVHVAAASCVGAALKTELCAQDGTVCVCAPRPVAALRVRGMPAPEGYSGVPRLRGCSVWLEPEGVLAMLCHRLSVERPISEGRCCCLVHPADQHDAQWTLA